MHIVPAPAESLMKSRVLSIPGLQGVMDKGSAAFQTFRERRAHHHHPPASTITSQRPCGGGKLMMVEPPPRELVSSRDATKGRRESREG